MTGVMRSTRRRRSSTRTRPTRRIRRTRCSSASTTLDVNGANPTPTGRLIDGAIEGNIGNWNEVKAQAASHPRHRVGRHRRPQRPVARHRRRTATSSRPQWLAADGHQGPDGLEDTGDESSSKANPTTPISTANAVSSHHEFLNDIAHHAAPGRSARRVPGAPRAQDAGRATPFPVPTTVYCATYDDELLGRSLHHG